MRDIGSFPVLLALLPMPVKDLLMPARCMTLFVACTCGTSLKCILMRIDLNQSMLQPYCCPEKCDDRRVR